MPFIQKRRQDMKKKLLIIPLIAALTAGAFSLPVFASDCQTELGPAAVNEGSSASVSAEKVPLGGNITVTAANAGADSFYAFYYRLQGKENWVCSKSYSEETSAKIKASSAGKYEVLVKTKSSSGKITKEYLSFTSVDDLSVNGALSASRTTLGVGVTVAARATGGNGGYTYSVLRRKSGDSSWKTIIKDSTSCNAVVTPASVGEYEVCIKVKDKAGIIRKEYLSFEAVDFSIDVSLKYDQLSLGSSQKITASLSEGASDCSILFYFKNPTDKDWRLIKNDSGVNTVSLKPAKTGTYSICAKAVNSAGKVRKAYAEFSVAKGLTVSHSLSSETIEEGSSLTVTPSSTGGNGSVQYAVYYTTKEQYESGANSWITALKFGQTGKAVITPENTGEYVVVTKAKDQSGTIKKTAYTYFTVVKKLSAQGQFKNNRNYVTYNSSTTFMAEAQGGSGSYTYTLKFRKTGAAEWKTLAESVTDTQFVLSRNNIGGTENTQKSSFELQLTVIDKNGFTAETVYPFTVNYSDKYELPIILT